MATAGLLLSCCFTLPAAIAQDGVVMISDSFSRKTSSKKQKRRTDNRVRRTSCDTGCCDIGCCDSVGCGDGCCRPWWAHRSGFSGEFLYLHATDADVAHAQQQNGIGGAGTVPFGRIGTVSAEHEPGIRVGASKALTDCSSLVMSYTFFESKAFDNVVLGGGGEVGSFVHHPGASITASAGPVNAFQDVDFELADVAYRALWKASSLYAINWTVGGRYGQLLQDFRQIGSFAAGAAAEVDTRTSVEFEGAGLLFGIDGERRIGCGGWSMYGRGNVSPMSGRVHGDYISHNNSTGPFCKWRNTSSGGLARRSHHHAARGRSRPFLDGTPAQVACFGRLFEFVLVQHRDDFGIC